jgi:glycosyltransferase involved in cell wall biosynthesis
MEQEPQGRRPRGEIPVIAEGLFSFETGGSERVGADVALECARRGYRVVCFAFYGSEGPIRRELEANGVVCADLNYLKRARFVRRFTYQSALARFFRSHNVHAVHIHHATSLILGGLAARLARVPRIVMTEHSLFELQTMSKYRRQSRRYCRFADAISVVHPSMESFFLSMLGVPRRKLHYIPNGVRLQRPDAPRRLALRQALGFDERTFLWMFAGRLAAVKGLESLIRAFAHARVRGNHHFRLVLIGDGSERSALENLSHSLDLDNVISFLGLRADVPTLLTAADGFVMSSRSEGLPMVLLEAMAGHVPCLATAVGGIPELFLDGAGMLVPPADTLALSNALVEFAGDPELRRRFSETAFKKVAATNDLHRVVDQYLELFALPSRWPREIPQPRDDAAAN